MSASLELTDRYQALGMPYPDPETMCLGHCEGIGCYPSHRPHPMRAANPLSSQTAREISEWDKLHAESHNYWFFVKQLWKNREWWYWRSIFRDLLAGKLLECDGWHFIRCADCNGTGKRIQ